MSYTENRAREWASEQVANALADTGQHRAGMGPWRQLWCATQVLRNLATSEFVTDPEDLHDAACRLDRAEAAIAQLTSLAPVTANGILTGIGNGTKFALPAPIRRRLETLPPTEGDRPLNDVRQGRRPDQWVLIDEQNLYSISVTGKDGIAYWIAAAFDPVHSTPQPHGAVTVHRVTALVADLLHAQHIPFALQQSRVEAGDTNETLDIAVRLFREHRHGDDDPLSTWPGALAAARNIIA